MSVAAPVRSSPRSRRASDTHRSLHQRIAHDVRSRILSGRWRPGKQIPFEIDLALAYDCSRMTVNKALTELVRAGLIERRRRAGSFVRAPHARAALLEIRDLRDEVEALGLAYRFVRLARRKTRATAVDCARLGLTAAVPVIRISCLHFAGDEPYCHEDRVINLAAVPSVDAVMFDVSAPGPWLVAHVPWTDAEHRIVADVPGAMAAAHLGLATTTPCLIIERNTWRQDLPVTHVRFTYPGHLRQLIARFAPAASVAVSR